jgi:hypothetical protein
MLKFYVCREVIGWAVGYRARDRKIKDAQRFGGKMPARVAALGSFARQKLPSGYEP